MAAGQEIKGQDNLILKTHPNLEYDLGQITANACLAHDIGNPPFGHAGEKAIGQWFKTQLPKSLADQLSNDQRADFDKFEGNAQGFRLLTKLQDNRNDGGLRLTYSTLAAFTKYPTSSLGTQKDQYIGEKKYGYFSNDISTYTVIAKELELMPRKHGWCRHPLVFLVEAADDICYRVIDVEDAYKLKRFTFTEAENFLSRILDKSVKYERVVDEMANIGWLRAMAIYNLINCVIATFKQNLDSISAGTYSKSLIEDVPCYSELEEMSVAVRNKVFGWDRTIHAEIAGAQMIIDVLERLIFAIEKPDRYINTLLLKIVPSFKNTLSVYEQLLLVTDFVSGMTDSYLQRIHKKLTGQVIN